MATAIRKATAKNAAVFAPHHSASDDRLSKAGAYSLAYSLLLLLEKIGNPMTEEDWKAYSEATGADNYNNRRDMLADVLAGRRVTPVKVAAAAASPARRETAKGKGTAAATGLDAELLATLLAAGIPAAQAVKLAGK